MKTRSERLAAVLDGPVAEQKARLVGTGYRYEITSPGPLPKYRMYSCTVDALDCDDLHGHGEGESEDAALDAAITDLIARLDAE